jgi:flavin-binding protein dodecin
MRISEQVPVGYDLLAASSIIGLMGISLRHPSGRMPYESKEDSMGESVYKVIELVGTSTESWEKAAAAAVSRAAKSLRELRIAEIVELDMQLDDGKVVAYRAKVKVSFKYEDD